MFPGYRSAASAAGVHRRNKPADVITAHRRAANSRAIAACSMTGGGFVNFIVKRAETAKLFVCQSGSSRHSMHSSRLLTGATSLSPRSIQFRQPACSTADVTHAAEFSHADPPSVRFHKYWARLIFSDSICRGRTCLAGSLRGPAVSIVKCSPKRFVRRLPCGRAYYRIVVSDDTGCRCRFRIWKIPHHSGLRDMNTGGAIWSDRTPHRAISLGSINERWKVDILWWMSVVRVRRSLVLESID